MGINRLDSIARAARGKPATGGKERRNKKLVSTNKTNKYFLHKNEQKEFSLRGSDALKKINQFVRKSRIF